MLNCRNKFSSTSSQPQLFHLFFDSLSLESICTLPSFPKKQPSIPSQSICNPYQVIDNLSNYHFKEIVCSPTVFVLAPIMHINGHNGNGLYKFPVAAITIYNKFS